MYAMSELRVYSAKNAVQQLLILLLIIAWASCTGRSKTTLLDGEKTQRILFLGNSITFNGKFIKDMEVYYTIHYPERQLEFINLGLPSETVSGLSEDGHADGEFPRPDLHERLGRVLDQVDPDLVFANYGMNDGIYLPLRPDRFQKFKDGMVWLHEQVKDSGAQIIHLTPPVYDETKGGSIGYDDVLEYYSQWLLEQRDAADWTVVDIHGPTKAYLEKRRKEDSEFALALDGVHLGEEGHWIMAREILCYLGEERVLDMADINEAVAAYPAAEQLIGAVNERQNIMRDAWLDATGHKRPGLKSGLPMEKARERAAELEKKIKELQRILPDKPSVGINLKPHPGQPENFSALKYL